MRNKFFEYKYFAGMTILSILLTFSSTWVIRTLAIPDTINKVITLILYGLFAVTCVWKFLLDVKSFKQEGLKASDYVYYSFIVYYIILSCYRIFKGLEVKENLYFSCIFLGSVASFQILCKTLFADALEMMHKNLLAIAIFLILYYVGYSIIGVHFFENMPININIILGVLVLVFPTCFYLLNNMQCSRTIKAVTYAVEIMILLTVFSAGSRVMFYLSVFTLFVLLCSSIKSKQKLIHITVIAGTAILLFSIAFAMNLGTVRYSFYRESDLPFLQNQLSNSIDVLPENTAPSEEIKLPEENELQSDKKSAQTQILHSDHMRSDLFEMGLTQIAINPIFGTGDVYYEYCINENYTPIQSSHNFIIEVLCGYGFVGLAVIVVFFLTVLAESSFFVRGDVAHFDAKFMIIFVTVLFLGFSFVQPLFFDSMTLPIYVMCISVFAVILQSNRLLSK